MAFFVTTLLGRIAPYGKDLRMSTNKPSRVVASNARLALEIKDGRLIFSINLPLRWTLLVIGIVTAATGYPMIAEVIKSLLHVG